LLFQGKTIRLQKHWHLLQADDEQPRTDCDIDCCMHENQEEDCPPSSGWSASHDDVGLDPPPMLQLVGLMVPSEQELETLECQLVAWVIQNKIAECVLGDEMMHSEVLSHSMVLFDFLTTIMCKWGEQMRNYIVSSFVHSYSNDTRGIAEQQASNN